MNKTIDTATITVGVVGLGLMGCSIATCLLLAGHTVIAVAPVPIDLEQADKRVLAHLTQSQQQGLTSQNPAYFLQHLHITENYALLKECKVVIECTIENAAIKKSVYDKIEAIISSETILASNTSAIPISILQQLTQFPGRFFGLHWAEPSHTTRFLEIICGEASDPAKADFLCALSHHWNKEPTLVKKDIRGFIANRLMYAMYREAIYLVENGYATIEDVDRACRNNTGYWMTLVGVFRWMDLTGVPAYHTVMKDLFPALNNSIEVPELIDKIVREGGKGVANAHGFYQYTSEEAKCWEETFTAFSYDIRELALKYPADIVQKKMAAEKNKE
ncbi:MAG: 3-hydroxyacyl-CoA dehydrogenase family protein [Chitinophagaceae bacterium]